MFGFQQRPTKWAPQPAEKQRAKRAQLPLTGLRLGVKFTVEDFLHTVQHFSPQYDSACLDFSTSVLVTMQHHILSLYHDIPAFFPPMRVYSPQSVDPPPFSRLALGLTSPPIALQAQALEDV
ncbi:hypothetical protein EYF80_013537 [Liparis tanakae]|uniref:Uncharacterized protein n=1 Tax=Liparis tanakae TaxID=230148 RepID=A0A4Z2IDT7_9TELE|nr:hypothetical protein EYF80_013537 [Liparis tanakae]